MADVTTGANAVMGDTAHDAADVGRPIKIGGKANAALPTAVTEGDRVDASFDLQGRQRVVTDHSVGTLGHGVTNVTTAGTDVALAGSAVCKWVVVQAQSDNTGYIAVGITGVDATVATGNGVLLAPGQAVTIPIDNLSKVFIDATVNGEGVRYLYGAA